MLQVITHGPLTVAESTSILRYIGQLPGAGDLSEDLMQWKFWFSSLPSIWDSIALWQSGDMGEKCNKKVVNFGNWFLCQFSPKTYKFLHGASLTPQKSGDEKKFKKYGQARGEKSKWKKNVKGVFFTDKTGLNLILSQKEILFVKQTFVKNTP